MIKAVLRGDMVDYVGALDLGTTSNRFILFDHGGNIVTSYQKEHRQIFPRPGWVEHDPLEIWQTTQDVVQGALNKSGISGSDIIALGITNQRETTVIWDRHTGRPYYNAIVWQCTRTDEICRRLFTTEGQDQFREKTGLPISTYFSGPKIRWILDEISDARAAADRGDAMFGTIDSWIIWWLTGGPHGGVHITDVTNASRTMLMNLHTLDWDSDILSVLDLPRQILPVIVPSIDYEVLGYTKADGPFNAAIPVCGVLGDQQAALVGQTCFLVGDAKNTYGTGCFLLLNTGTSPVSSQKGLLTTVGYQIRGEKPVYCLEGSIAVAGALVQWIRDNLGLIGSTSEIEVLARSVPDNGGAYIVPAFSGLFAPYWRPDARGVITGLTRFIGKGHISRAALEATAYQTRDIVEAMQADSGVPLIQLKVDGGMVRNDLLMQFQADILNVPVIRPRVSETTALGAAYAAGLGAGYWSNMEELRQNWSADITWTPRMSESDRENKYRNWQKAIERTLNWVD